MTEQLSNTQEFSIFEYPATEDIRNFLRLEKLFNDVFTFVEQTSAHSHLAALRYFYDILDLLEAGETKPNLIKQLDKLADQFSKFAALPEVDSSKLEKFLQQVTRLQNWAANYQGKFGQQIRKDPFICATKHRMAIPGAYTDFDLPELKIFLQLPYDQRKKYLNDWLLDLQGVKTSIEVILKLLRDNGQFQPQQVTAGSFQMESASLNWQLLRIKVPAKMNVIPEVSAGKFRLSMHLYHLNDSLKKVKLEKDCEIQLALCRF